MSADYLDEPFRCWCRGCGVTEVRDDRSAALDFVDEHDGDVILSPEANLRSSTKRVATDGGEDQGDEDDEDDEDGSRRLDNPHWRDRFVPDGGVPQFDRVATGTCENCGDEVPIRWLNDGVCVGCRERQEVVTDGGRDRVMVEDVIDTDELTGDEIDEPVLEVAAAYVTAVNSGLDKAEVAGAIMATADALRMHADVPTERVLEGLADSNGMELRYAKPHDDDVLPDGGRVQEDTRQCARCDADAVPGSRFCLGHLEARPDGGRSPDDFEVDPRNMSMGRTPAVLEERLGDDDTGRVSFADFELHESGAVKFTQFDGRKGLLPQWRWADIEFIPTEGFTDHGQNKRRQRVAPAFWSLLPEQVRETFDPPGEAVAVDGVDDE